jgi:REP element-mobilizing transposase RayT
MFDNPHRRHSIRLPGYDYSQSGAYFVTLVTHRRECILGKITGEKMQLSLAGEAVAAILQRLSKFFKVELKAWVIMPNHVHAILVVPNPEGEASQVELANKQQRFDRDASPLPPRGTTNGTLAAMVQNYKSVTARRINSARGTPGSAVWQRNYYEHIIRNTEDYERIWEYIADNPRSWAEDSLSPKAAG